MMNDGDCASALTDSMTTGTTWMKKSMNWIEMMI
jgi:hypothetical protein